MDFENIAAEVINDQLTIIMVPLFALAILLEVWVSWKRQQSLYLGKDTLTSIAMLVTSSLVDALPKLAAFAAFTVLHTLSPFQDIIGRQWWAWLLLLLLDDVTYYWFHRANHEVRLFWAGHISHHSSEYMNFGTALRQGVGERTHKYFFWAWLALLGFDATMIFTMMALSLFYQFWIHTELVRHLPKPFEAIFNTPSHHRVHHGSNIQYLDRNHAGILIIWDKLFGTFSPESEKDRVVYGLTTNINRFNPLFVAGHEYVNIWRDIKRADKMSDKLKYLFLAPGWSHDGDDKRANTLRNSLNS